MKKLSKMQLRRLMESEATSIERRRIIMEQKSANMVAEGLGSIVANIPKYAKQGAQALGAASTFIAGVRKFLKDNEDWIDPLWEMLKDMKASRGDTDVESGEVVDIDVSDDSLDIDGDIVDFSDYTDTVSGDVSDSSDSSFSYDVEDLVAEANDLYRRHSKKRK